MQSSMVGFVLSSRTSRLVAGSPTQCGGRDAHFDEDVTTTRVGAGRSQTKLLLPAAVLQPGKHEAREPTAAAA